MRAVIGLFVLAAFAATPAAAAKLIEPHMHIAPGGAVPQVALTLDACEGAVDMRIVDALVADQIPATIFVTGRWLKRNIPAIRILAAHPELFEIEDHGALHIPAIIGTQKAYGIAPAGTANAVFAEVLGGAQAVTTSFNVAPHWYRDATALYSRDALALIDSMGFKVGGFSLNGDFGATSPEAAVAKRIGGASDGDVIIAHVNQPTHSSGAGVVEGIEALKARGYKFVRLEDVAELPG